MKRGLIAPPAIQVPAPRQPSYGSEAAKAQAALPGCQNPNRPALWAVTGKGLKIMGVPKTRYRSVTEETDAFRAQAEKDAAAAAEAAAKLAEPKGEMGPEVVAKARPRARKA